MSRISAPLLTPDTDGTLAANLDTRVATQKAIKAYVDAVAAGLTPSLPVDLATTGALPAGTYSNGSSGVGATFTVTATGTLTVDSVVTSLNQRILVQNQASAFQNGVYLVTTAGAVGVAAVLTRATDSDTGAEIQGGMYAVNSGTANAGTFLQCTNASIPVMGTDAITFGSFTPVSAGGKGGVTFGTGLTKSGNTVSVSPTITGNNQTGTSYTLVLADAGKVVECNNASAITLTIPPVSSVAWSVGTVIEIWQQGAGQVTVTAGAGVTLRSDGAKVKTAAQYATIGLRMRANDEWIISGDTA